MAQQWQDPYQRRPVDIEAYAPPRRTTGALWFVVAALVSVGVVLAALFLRPTTAIPSPTPSATGAAPTGSALPGMPFTMPNSSASTGRWEIVSQEWDAGGLVVRVRVTCDTGLCSYRFAAFSNAGTEVYEPQTGAPDPEIGAGALRPRESIDGHLRIAMPKGPATLVLTTAGGEQISALPIDG